MDSSAVIDRHWAIWAARHNLDLNAILACMAGKRSIEVMATFAPHLDVAQEAAELDAADARDSVGLRAYPGAVELIASLPANRWAIATSGARETALIRLHTAGIPVPSILICAGDVQLGKPHPEPYLMAAERLGIAPERCAAIEDAPSGVSAAQNAGMITIGIAATVPPGALSEADAVIPTLATLRCSLLGEVEQAALDEKVLCIST
ncbi:MAG: HAD-IA family hydrolase [Anaerolineales bacterium]|nr:HAD-IA family hydrolase [Anaerolineales bacterium]